MTQQQPHDFPDAELSLAAQGVTTNHQHRDHGAGADARLPSAHVSMNFDPEFAQPTTASAEAISYAQELRRQLRLRYPERPDVPGAPWCVGAD